MIFNFALSVIFPFEKLTADVIFPNDDLVLQLMVLAFGFNFIINFIVFSLGAVIFAKGKIKFPAPALLILLLTMSGLLMDFLGIFVGSRIYLLLGGNNFGMMAENYFYFCTICFAIAVFISGLDFLIIKKYLRLDKKRSLKLAIWMGIITNPGWIFFLYL